MHLLWRNPVHRPFRLSQLAKHRQTPRLNLCRQSRRHNHPLNFWQVAGVFVVVFVLVLVVVFVPVLVKGRRFQRFARFQLTGWGQDCRQPRHLL
jgi:hypothetical protein